MTEFKDNLKYLINRSGKTQSVIAQELKMTPQALSYYVNGRNPNIKILKKIANHFKVTTDFLIGVDEVPVKTVVEADDYLGLSEAALTTLEYCLKQSKTNSFTLTLNALLENKGILMRIAQYLYYDMNNVIAYGSKYKYKDPTSYGYKIDYIDGGDWNDILTNNKLKKLELIEINEALEELRQKEAEKETSFIPDKIIESTNVKKVPKVRYRKKKESTDKERKL